MHCNWILQNDNEYGAYKKHWLTDCGESYLNCQLDNVKFYRNTAIFKSHLNTAFQCKLVSQIPIWIPLTETDPEILTLLCASSVPSNLNWIQHTCTISYKSSLSVQLQIHNTSFLYSTAASKNKNGSNTSKVYMGLLQHVCSSMWEGCWCRPAGNSTQVLKITHCVKNV